MTVKIDCPNPECGTSYQIRESHLGRNVLCGACGFRFVLAVSPTNPAGGASSTGRPGADGAKERGGVPSQLGRFEVRQRVGAGAFGAVFRAYDPMLDREVALKVPHSGTLHAERERARFFREAKAAAQLRHPNIVPVYESGADGDTCFIASAFIEGRTVDEAIDERPLEPRRVAQIVKDVALALDYAHRKGIVHRDVKPGNIMLDANGDPLLLDFGLARLLESEDKLTHDGAVLGTPAYMSPEQARGDLGQVGPRSDQYSLGAVLYELLCGVTPFSGPPAMVISMVINQEPEPPGSQRPQIPKDLETICLKAMSKSPPQRYADCGELAEDLRRWLEGEPILARRLGVVERAVRWCARNRLLAALSAAAVGLLIAVASLATVAYFREAGRLRAVEDAQDAMARSLAAETALRREETAAREREEALRREETAAKEREKTQRSLAEQQMRRADCLRLAAESRVALQRFPERSLLLAAEAVESARTRSLGRIPAAEEALREVLAAVGGKPLRGHGLGLHCSTISPDSRWLVTGNSDGTARLWDLNARDPAANPVILRGHSGWVWCLVVSADGRWLVSGSVDTTARLWDLTAPDPAAKPIVLAGHNTAVTSVATSPDSRRLAIGGLDGDIRLWDLTAASSAGRSVLLRGHREAVDCLAFSPDGRRLVSGSRDHSARVWDLSKDDPAQEACTLPHSNSVHSIRTSTNGQWLVTATPSETRVWRLSSEVFARQPAFVLDACWTGVDISPDCRWLAISGWDNAVRVWDLTAGQPPATPLVLRGHEAQVQCLVFSPDSHWLATASHDGTARMWNMAARDPGAKPSILRGHEGALRGVQFSRDRKWLVTLCGQPHSLAESGTVRLWDLVRYDRMESQMVLTGDTAGGGECLAVSPNGLWLVTGQRTSWGGPDGSVSPAILWELPVRGPTAKPLVLKGHEQDVTKVAISSDSRWLATGSNDGTVRIWPLGDTDPTMGSRVLRGHDKPITCLAFLSDNRRLVTAGKDACARLWDLSAAGTSAPPVVLRGHKEDITCMAMLPGDERLATGSADGTVRLWNLKSQAPGTESSVLGVHGAPITCMAISADGRLLVIGSSNHSVRSWNLQSSATARDSRLFGGCTYPVAAVTLGANGRWLAAAGGPSVCLWDLFREKTDDIKPILLRRHEQAVTSLAISRDGRCLASGSPDRTVRLWDLTSPEPNSQAVVLRGHTESLRGLAFTPDDHWLVSLAWNGQTTMLWNLRVDELLDLARRRAGRTFMDHERSLYLLPQPEPQAPQLPPADAKPPAAAKRELRGGETPKSPAATNVSAPSSAPSTPTPPGPTPPSAVEPKATKPPPETRPATPAAKPADSTKSAPPVDLLALVDPARHAPVGTWQKQGGTLLSPVLLGARIEIPYVPPEAYDVTVEGQRVSGRNGLVVGLVSQGHRFIALVDFLEGQRPVSALEDVDRQRVTLNETTAWGDALPLRERFRVVCRVRPEGVAVETDGKRIIAWRGDPSRLSLNPYWRTPNESVLFLGAHDCGFRFDRVELTSQSGQGRVLSDNEFRPSRPLPRAKSPQPSKVVPDSPRAATTTRN